MNLPTLRSLRPVARGFVCAIALAATSGCTTVAQSGFDYATRRIIDLSSSLILLDQQTMELAAHVETKVTPPGSGAIVVQLKAAESWPKGWHPMRFSFRPQGSSESFNVVEISPDGALLRMAGKDGLQPETATAVDRRIIRLQLTSVSSQPYELLVDLRHADGRRANMARRSITVP